MIPSASQIARWKKKIKFISIQRLKTEILNSNWNLKGKNIKSQRREGKKLSNLAGQKLARKEVADSHHRNFYFGKFQHIGIKLIFIIFTAQNVLNI